MTDMGQALTVMVVEDDPDARHVVALLLRRAGYEVEEAGDGVEAASRMRARRYDAVITDYRMPRLNGLELAALCRDIWPGTPIIVVSGEPMSRVPAVSRSDAYAWLAKPIDHVQLVQLLRAAIEDACEWHVPPPLSEGGHP
ncbi:response regulator [Candidatus Nitrospira bockiana]